MSQPYKVCPQCQTPADLSDPACAKCGHVYRTQFVSPAQPTQMFQSPARTKQGTSGWTYAAGFCCGLPLLAVLGLAFLGSMFRGSTSAERSQPTQRSVSTAPMVRVVWTDFHITGAQAYITGTIENLTDQAIPNVQVSAWGRGRYGKLDIFAAIFVPDVNDMQRNSVSAQALRESRHLPNPNAETSIYTLPPHGHRRLIFNTNGYEFSRATKVQNAAGTEIPADIQIIDGNSR